MLVFSKVFVYQNHSGLLSEKKARKLVTAVHHNMEFEFFAKKEFVLF